MLPVLTAAHPPGYGNLHCFLSAFDEVDPQSVWQRTYHPMEMAPRRRDDARTASRSLALAVLAMILGFHPVATAAREAAHVSHTMFSYEKGSSGPDKWASLQKEWTTCGDGTKQSPINIVKVENHKDLGALKQTYRAGAAIMQNRGHDFMLKWKDVNGKLSIQGKEYTIQQVHWHAPAEHTINGTSFDAEMHMVHEASDKARAVVAVLFRAKAGTPSKLLNDLEPGFRSLAGKENAEEELKKPINPAAWIDQASGYYRYEGSLTTPPCTEGVVWTIMSKVKDGSREQIDLLKSAAKPVEPNARPAQKVNGRVVRYYEGQTKG